MIKYLLFILLFTLFLKAEDSLNAQKQNALYVQNMIEIEENISKMFEKYLLSEFKIPTLDNLKTDDYLGSNFSTTNKMGSNIAFESTSDLKIKYAITNDLYRNEKTSGIDNYIVKLYNRDLYRNYTSAYEDSTTLSKSYIEIVLHSDEAKTIFSLLKDGNTIAKTCTSILTSTYCNNNQKTIRWYNASSQWIEYDKINFNNYKINLNSKTENILNKYTYLIEDRINKINSNVKVIIIWILISLGKLFKDKNKKKISITDFILIALKNINNDESINKLKIDDLYEFIKYKKIYYNLLENNTDYLYTISKDATASGIQHLIRILGEKNDESFIYANMNSELYWYDTYNYIIDNFFKKNNIPEIYK